MMTDSLTPIDETEPAPKPAPAEAGDEKNRMNWKLRVVLALRFTLSYIVGIVGGILIVKFLASGFGPDFLMLTAFLLLAAVLAVMITWPLYMIGLFVFVIFAESVAKHRGLWSASAFLLTTASWFAMPLIRPSPSATPIETVKAMVFFGGPAALCAGISSATFYCWNFFRRLD